MSYGYDRTPSPAQRKRNARVLTALKISEVSSVDRGAGHGVRVLLLKRDGKTERTEPMSTLETVAKSLTDVSLGRIAPFEAVEIHKTLAREAGLDLNKWYAETDEGKSALHGLITVETTKAMTMNPLGDGYRVAKSNPNKEHNRDARAGASPFKADPNDDRNPDSHDVGVDDDSDDRAAAADKMIKMQMAIGKSYDEAVTVVHRIEQGRA